jgi:hypothetical protein
MSPESIASFLAVALGFAVAGMVSALYQFVTREPPSFALIVNARAATLALMPLLAFAAPFIILRTMLRAPPAESRRFETVMTAMVVAGLWSMLSGTVVELAFDAAQRLIA